MESINEKLLIKLLEKTKRLEDYVILKKDDKGFYIEYAFKPGAPHDNRCLSWYDSYQEKAYERNGWFNNVSEETIAAYKESLLKKRLNKVGKIYELQDFTCGWERYSKSTEESDREAWEKYHPGEPYNKSARICKVGCPASGCTSKGNDWTYEEPVKCACWNLGEEVNPEKLRFTFSLKDIQELIKDGRLRILDE